MSTLAAKRRKSIVVNNKVAVNLNFNRVSLRRNAAVFPSDGKVQIGESIRVNQRGSITTSIEELERQKKYQRRRRRISLVLSNAEESHSSSIASDEGHQNVSKASDRSQDRNDRIVINVGGIRHETFRSTLRLYPDTRLGWIAINGIESIDAYDSSRNEYFFDRHPNAFSHIMNFYRTGKLHAPSDICGPLFEEELLYWGLDEKSMEPCCWSKYTEHRDAQENLKVFDNPILNPLDEDGDVVSRYDRVFTKSTRNRSKLLSSVIKTLQPSCFKSKRWLKWKRNIWLTFEDSSAAPHATLSRAISILSLTFILLSVASLCCHSVLNENYEQYIRDNKNATNEEEVMKAASNLDGIVKTITTGLDIVCCAWFTLEYILRLISAPSRTRFLFDLMNIFDILTIVPYFIYLTDFNGYITEKNHVLPIISISRLFRLFRFFRLSTGLQILKHTMIASSKELLLLLLLLLIPVAIFATIIYYCERKVSGTKFKTIPESFWWAIITMTTVGYGDMAPTTSVGKFFGALCATCSVLILALPVSVIGNNFTLFYHYAQARLKLPKREKKALVGAANALVSDTNQPSQEGDEEALKHELSLSDGFLNGNISYSKRFRRERLSLYTTNSNARRSPSCRSDISNTNSTNTQEKSDENEQIVLRTSKRSGEVNSSFENEDSSASKESIDHNYNDGDTRMRKADSVDIQLPHSPPSPKGEKSKSSPHIVSSTSFNNKYNNNNNTESSNLEEDHSIKRTLSEHISDRLNFTQQIKIQEIADHPNESSEQNDHFTNTGKTVTGLRFRSEREERKYSGNHLFVSQELPH